MEGGAFLWPHCRVHSTLPWSDHGLPACIPARMCVADSPVLASFESPLSPVLQSSEFLGSCACRCCYCRLIISTHSQNRPYQMNRAILVIPEARGQPANILESCSINVLLLLTPKYMDYPSPPAPPPPRLLNTSQNFLTGAISSFSTFCALPTPTLREHI